MCGAMFGCLATFAAMAQQVPSAGHQRDPLVPPTADGTPVSPTDYSLVVGLVARFQYVPQAPNEAFATKVLRVYEDRLDPERLFFMADDIAAFDTQAATLSSGLKSDDTSVPDAIARRHAARVGERLQYAMGLLQKGFDLVAPETLDAVQPGDEAFLAQHDLDERWRKIVKSDWLELKLDGFSDAAIRATLTARYMSFQERLQKNDSQDARIAFLDAYALAGAEGSRYFPHDIAHGGYLPRLGLALTHDADGPQVAALSPRVATRFAGRIHTGDRVVSVAIDKASPTYLDGWNLSDTLALLGGPDAAQATLHMTLRRRGVAPGGPLEHVTLEQGDVVDDGKASMRDVPIGDAGDAHAAVISLSTFYEDAQGRLLHRPDFESSARDVKGLLLKARTTGAQAVVLDLRGNGGGANAAAADLASLFVGQRPLWRLKKAQGLELGEGDTADPVWTGPLAVLVDGNSAGASEMLAAAMQDNQRALVLGSPTHGMCNIASLLDLSRLDHTHSSSTHGTLKLTVATAFRANGDNLTGHGVTPDILLPFEQAARTPGPALMTFDAIAPTPTSPMMALSKALPELRRAHDERMAHATMDSHDPVPLPDRWPLDLATRTSLRHADAAGASPDTRDAALLHEVALIVADEKRLLSP